MVDVIMNNKNKIEKDLSYIYSQIESICEYNSLKVLKAFNECKVNETHFNPVMDDENIKSLPNNFFYYDDEKKEGEEDSSNKYSIFGGNDPLKENNTEEELLS